MLALNIQARENFSLACMLVNRYEALILIRLFVVVFQVSVTNQEQWEEMRATKGLTGKNRSNSGC